jgi:hypothetical protein
VDPRGDLDDVEKRQFLTLPGLELRPLGRQHVARRYTDYAIPAPLCNGDVLFSVKYCVVVFRFIPNPALRQL